MRTEDAKQRELNKEQILKVQATHNSQMEQQNHTLSNSRERWTVQKAPLEGSGVKRMQSYTEKKSFLTTKGNPSEFTGMEEKTNTQIHMHGRFGGFTNPATACVRP